MNQKSQLKFNKCGYLQIDFAFGLVGFLIFFVLIYGVYADYKNTLIVENKLVELTSDAENLCFQLVNSNGYPNDWYLDISNSNFIGLKKNDSWQLDSNKLNVLIDDNYFDILNKLEIDSNIGVNIKGINSNTNYVNFGVFADNISVMYSNYICYSIYNSEIVRVSVEAWK